MPELKERGKYLKSDMVKNGDLILITSGGQYVTKEFTKGQPTEKLEIMVQLPSKESKVLTLNTTSEITLRKAYGSNSDKWVGKYATCQIVAQRVGSAIKNVLYLEPVQEI